MLKESNMNYRDHSMTQKSNRMRSLLTGIDNQQKLPWKMSLKSFRTMFYSDYRREMLIQYIFKSVANTLPTKANLVKWKKSISEECLTYGEKEDLIHILKASCNK